jgi:hypothetical protein
MAVAAVLSLVLLCIEFRVQFFTNLLNPLLTLGLLIAALLQYGVMNKQATILSDQLDEAKQERISASIALKEAENVKEVAQNSANNARHIERNVNMISTALQKQILSFATTTILSTSRGQRFGDDYYVKIDNEIRNEAMNLLSTVLTDPKERREWIDEVNKRAGKKILKYKE